MAHNQQGSGRKKSNFPVVESVPAGANQTVFVNGTNYQITYANYLAGLGVTGTIVQSGSPLGTPVLDAVGIQNNIRNLENGSGVKASVSAQNGITLAHTFIQDTLGLPVLKDPTSLTPTIRSLVQGSGISLAVVNGAIQIATSATPVTTKTVIISELSDFPAPVSGQTIGEDDTDYFLVNDITNPNEFVCGNNSVFRAADSAVITYEYTGVGTAFVCADGDAKLTKFKLIAATGTAIDVSSVSGNNVFQMIDMTVEECDIAGSVTNMGALQITDVAWNDIKTDGISYVDPTGIFICQNNLIFLNGGTFLDLGTSTFNGFNFLNSFVAMAGGTTMISGLTASGNINSGQLGVVSNIQNIGVSGTALSGVDPDDARWNFTLNSDIPDTRPDALISLTNNATATTIASSNTPVKLAGTWNLERSAQFTTDTTGRATYNGEKNAVLPITMSFTAIMASGGTDSITFYVAINGSIVVNSGASNDHNSSTAGRTTMPWQYEFTPGDFVEAWVENNSDTTDVLVTDAAIVVN